MKDLGGIWAGLTSLRQGYGGPPKRFARRRKTGPYRRRSRSVGNDPAPRRRVTFEWGRGGSLDPPGAINVARGRTFRVASAVCAVLITAAPTIAAGRIVNLSAADGTPLVGTFYEAAPQPTPCVLLVHMLGRQRDDWAGVAERLQQQGLSALTIDLRGHGSSGGTRTPLPRMTADVSAAVRWLTSRSAVRPNAIGIAGASLGASLALLAAVDLPPVRSLALLSPSLDYRGVRIDPTLVRKYGARPILFVASSEDPYALRSLRDLAADTSGIREQRLASVAAHGTVLLNADPDLPSALVDWFRRTLIF